MKTISELQQEIRSMQTELHNINERLTELNDELLNYKDSGISDSIYKRIYEIAETMPIIKHPIINYGYSVKNNYFAILVLIATCEDSINDEQLLFLQRMAMADSQRTSIDLYIAGMGSISRENVIFKIQESIKGELSYQLLLDMLIIANLSMIKTRKTFEVIANIAGFLKIKKDELTHVSYIASIVLKNEFDVNRGEIGRTALMDSTLYGYYLTEIPRWNDMLLRLKEEHQRDDLMHRFVFVLKNKMKLNQSNMRPIGLELSAIEEYGEDWYYYE